MKFSGISFFMLAVAMTTVMTPVCLGGESLIDVADTKNNEQIIFDIDGVNSAIRNSCPDDGHVDSYDQDTDELYEDETDEYTDDQDSMPYEVLNDNDEEDDESDLDEYHESSFVQSIKKYTTERAVEKKSLVVEDPTGQPDEQQDTTADTIDFEHDLIAIESNSSPVIQEEQDEDNEHNKRAQLIPAKTDNQKLDTALFMDEEIDVQGNNVLGSTKTGHYDLMDYIQFVVINIKNRIKELFL